MLGRWSVEAASDIRRYRLPPGKWKPGGIAHHNTTGRAGLGPRGLASTLVLSIEGPRSDRAPKSGIYEKAASPSRRGSVFDRSDFNFTPDDQDRGFSLRRPAGRSQKVAAARPSRSDASRTRRFVRWDEVAGSGHQQ
jgi:hypothetical protein